LNDRLIGVSIYHKTLTIVASLEKKGWSVEHLMTHRQ